MEFFGVINTMAPLFVLVATFCQNIFEDSFLVLVSVFVPHLLLLQLDCAFNYAQSPHWAWSKLRRTR